MRETSFIEQNKHKWKEFEVSFENEKDPEKASNLFIQITDDLSYSRTYYPNRSVKIYLNNLAQKVFQTIYRNRVRRRRKLFLFWTDDLPLQLYSVRKQLFLSLMLFLVAFSIGIFSSMHDPDFARFILGDTYVNMTEANIEKGDPMAVYKEMNQFDMFLGITINNLFVAFITMIFGIILGVGTAYFIIYNGIMIGVFQYFFIQRGLFAESFLTIWVHGALEVSAIIVAGAAGLTLGKGFVFPGTYTRMQAFRLNGMRAIQTFLGVAPIIVLAAINESFLTRYTETPDIVRGILIALEFAFMIYYFVLLPKAKVRRGDTVKKRSDEIPPDRKPEIIWHKIKSGGEVFSDSFTMLKSFLGPLFLIIGILAFGYCFVVYKFLGGNQWLYHSEYVTRFDAIVEAIGDIRVLLNYHWHQLLFVMNATVFAVILTLSGYILRQAKSGIYRFSYPSLLHYMVHRGPILLLMAFALHAILYSPSNWDPFYFFCLPRSSCYVLVKWQMIHSNGKVSAIISINSCRSSFYIFH
ncbi:MAG: stage II sporulation protein M [Chitinophagales bacterium]